MKYNIQYDVVVVGGGHAGTEACLAAAKMGVKTLLITHNIDTIGQMSCNPAIGGIGKGHLVKEIDALGGVMAKAADYSGIHFRTLNLRKGPAVRATRAQADRILYKSFIRSSIEGQENLYILQDTVEDIEINKGKVVGVITKTGIMLKAFSVVITTGTFLSGRIHIGLVNYQGGRAGDPPANSLATKLRDYSFRWDRLKTGTPPRLDSKTINYTVLSEQQSETPLPSFSFTGNVKHHPKQISCFITETNTQTHDIIRSGLTRSPLYTGKIEGIGPRYCPSIEDKIIRFSEKEFHQIFLEPEGLTVSEVYPNGISTSLPVDIQYDLIHSIKGLENAHITRPGYAIEYDFMNPMDLQASLQSKIVEGLFLAGQINGTTGYEEAAAQGLIAGINAAKFSMEKESWFPRRDEAYIGVMIDDLISKGTNEPYRMFTSRAEYRLLLREDNADIRLTTIGRALGLIDDFEWDLFEKKQAKVEKEKARLESIIIRPLSIDNIKSCHFAGLYPKKEMKAIDLLKNPEIDYEKLKKFPEVGPGENNRIITEQVEIQVKYSGYISRQLKEIEKNIVKESYKLPNSINYNIINGLSNEVKEILLKNRPGTIGQASRLAGVTPASISLLLIYLKKNYGLVKNLGK